VPLHLIKDLRLVEFGRCNVHTVNHDPYTAPTYRADVVIDNAKFGALTVVAHRKPYILLGRDVLNQLILIADGPSETFELVSSKSKPQ
jgi:predicted aspartyl protease